MKIGSLFSGYGGLDMGVQAVLGGDVAWHCEIDPGASKVLARHFPDVPNLGDITAVDWTAVEPVDVLTGGFPCQDVSAAGKRRGLNSETRSGLWAQMVRAIDELRPSLVVAENVRGLLSACALSELEPCPRCLGDESQPHRPVLRALGRVVGDLSELGYVGRWGGLRAADIGAPHGRFRVFIIAWPAADTDSAASGERRLATPGQAEVGRPRADAGGRGGAPDPDATQLGRRPARRDDGVRAEGLVAGTTTDSEGHGRHEGWPEPAGLVGGPDAALGGDVATDTDGAAPARLADSSFGEAHGGTSAGRDRAGRVAWGPYEPAVHRWERRLGRPAPSPTELSAKGSARLSPTFVEWLMGLPAGWVTDAGLTRNEQLKTLGNGVVPQQAAEALRILLPDLERAA